VSEVFREVVEQKPSLESRVHDKNVLSSFIAEVKEAGNFEGCTPVFGPSEDFIATYFGRGE